MRTDRYSALYLTDPGVAPGGFSTAGLGFWDILFKGGEATATELIEQREEIQKEEEERVLAAEEARTKLKGWYGLPKAARIGLVLGAPLLIFLIVRKF